MIREYARPGICPFGEISFRELYARELFFQGIVCSANCSSGNCPLGAVRRGNILRELSTGKVHQGIARPGNIHWRTFLEP